MPEYYYYGRDCGDKMEYVNGVAYLTVYYPLTYPKKFHFMLTSSEMSAFVGAYIRDESLRLPENDHHVAMVVSRTDGNVHEVRFASPGFVWTIALTDYDLTVLGHHAQVSKDLSARELLSWRERYPRADVSGGTSPTDSHA